MAHLAHIVYNTGIRLYGLGVRVASLWNVKARQMVQGWQEWRQIEPLDDRPTAWFHVSSLGEFEQARPVMKRFKEVYPQYRVWVTFFSPSGYEVRKDTREADRVTYLPIDTPRNARRLVETIKPDVAFFVKYDFWFNTLRALKQQAVPTYIFSAIFRRRQFFFRPWGRWFMRQLQCFTHVFVQNEESMLLLRSHGMERCTRAGDTRFDRVREIAASTAGDEVVERFLSNAVDDAAKPGAAGRKCLVAGSTWEPDERNLQKWWDGCASKPMLIVAPHVISEGHLDYIEKLFGKGRCVRYSAVGGRLSAFSNRHEVLIIDNMGLLSRLYRYGDVSYIGGGFGRGIHNTLEAVAYGKPVVFGPNHTKFQEAMDLKSIGGGFSYKRAGELSAILDRLLGDEAAHRRASDACRAYVTENVGGTERIFSVVSSR